MLDRRGIPVRVLEGNICRPLHVALAHSQRFQCRRRTEFYGQVIQRQCGAWYSAFNAQGKADTGGLGLGMVFVVGNGIRQHDGMCLGVWQIERNAQGVAELVVKRHATFPSTVPHNQAPYRQALRASVLAESCLSARSPWAMARIPFSASSDMIGLGFGMAYRLCLLACVRHATPAEQAALSSKYAAVTYLSSMADVPLGGALGNLVGLSAATYMLFGFAALALIPLMRLAPKLGEVG